MPSNTLAHSVKSAFCAVLLLSLGACSEEPLSDIKAATVIEAVRSGDDKAWEVVRSKKVRWTGKVVQALMIHGDDFVKEFYLRYDPGFGAGAFAEVQINPSQAEDFKPGQAVTVTALILSHEKENETILVKLGSAKFE